tara:strand:- start:3740 stop:4288 length:549 start_codon:yes stop_codon:yes gene_type:complete
MKVLKWVVISLVSLAILLFGAFQYLTYNTKKMSPEATVSFVQGDYDVSIFYNRPSVRGRAIFGNLVPYGEVWRTGANEATTFTTKTDLEIQGQTLPAGKYSLWTIPGAEEWEIIFNSKEYPWGVNFNSEASWEAEFDVLSAQVYSEKVPSIIEQFTISLVKTMEGFEMQLAWENQLVRLPIK